MSSLRLAVLIHIQKNLGLILGLEQVIMMVSYIFPLSPLGEFWVVYSVRERVGHSKRKTIYSKTCPRQNVNKAETCSMRTNSILPAKRTSVIIFV
jgi:hypothetical protein